MKRFWAWLKAHFTVGRQTDFPDAETCDPNEPCRDVEPQEFDGVKGKFKF